MINFNLKTLDFLFNKAQIKAKKVGIEVLFKINYHEEINLDNLDLMVLIDNVLDNAVEHCGGNKKIVISLSPKNEYLELCVINSISTKYKKIDEKSTKIENGHGYGVKTIKEIARKKDIIIIFESKNYNVYCYLFIPRYLPNNTK